MQKSSDLLKLRSPRQAVYYNLLQADRPLKINFSSSIPNSQQQLKSIQFIPADQMLQIATAGDSESLLSETRPSRDAYGELPCSPKEVLWNEIQLYSIQSHLYSAFTLPENRSSSPEYMSPVRLLPTNTILATTTTRAPGTTADDVHCPNEIEFRTDNL
ncbi:hypothetical protein BKA69DRAFT_1121759 [Paraphysoderma sedebokerense]|nr:hypothetical protein BKA69DRAFT_1121759 [Paraphysoderma sedebokerense]